MNFDSYYDPPDDPPIHPLSDEACGLLQDAGVEQSVIDRITGIIDALAAQIDRECPQCERLAEIARQEDEKAAQQFLAENPPSALCPHGKEVFDCNPCLSAGDLAYDAMRERRYR